MKVLGGRVLFRVDYPARKRIAMCGGEPSVPGSVQVHYRACRGTPCVEWKVDLKALRSSSSFPSSMNQTLASYISSLSKRIDWRGS